MSSKVCAKCGVLKNNNEYSKLSRASDGLNYRCRVCCSEYYKFLYPRIKEAKRQYSKKRYYKKRDQILLVAALNYNPDKKRIYNKAYNTANKLKLNEKKNEYEKNRVKKDPNYRLIKNMRKMVLRSISNKSRTTFKELGYPKEVLVGHLGRLPNSDEAIDHKIPVSWFKSGSPISVISHYKNLQILSKSENCKKSNKLSHPVDYDYYLVAVRHIKEKYSTKITHK